MLVIVVVNCESMLSLLQWFIFLVFCVVFFFFLMIRRPPRSTQSRSSAASDVYKRQGRWVAADPVYWTSQARTAPRPPRAPGRRAAAPRSVSYTHLRAHETVLDLVCRLLLEKKNINYIINDQHLQLTNTTQHHHTNC